MFGGQTQRERHHLIRGQKAQWLQRFEVATLASLLPTTQLKKVILPVPIRQQRIEICLSISQEPAQSTLAQRCSQRHCKPFHALGSNAC